MPLKIRDFDSKGQVAVLNRWADGIEEQLKSSTGRINVVQTTANAAMTATTPAFADVVFSLSGRPNGSFVYAWVAFDRAITFDPNFAGSTGRVLTNPTSTAVFTIQKINTGGTVSIGTITVATSGAVTFASTGGLSQLAAVNDSFALLTPSSDPTLTGLMFTLKGRP